MNSILDRHAHRRKSPAGTAEPLATSTDIAGGDPASTAPADVESRLDEALQMTFPASDPISVSAQR
jgi:hypothetical protein